MFTYHIWKIIEIVMIIVGAKYISQLLYVNHTLQELNISFNNIGDDGIAVISEVLQHNKSLTTLRVDWCGLSAKGNVMCKMYCMPHKTFKCYMETCVNLFVFMQFDVNFF